MVYQTEEEAAFNIIQWVPVLFRKNASTSQDFVGYIGLSAYFMHICLLV